MKITNRRNFKGVPLKEWDVKEEHKDYFILQEPNGSAVLNYPKSSFENQKEHESASRDGDKFYIPEK